MSGEAVSLRLPKSLRGKGDEAAISQLRQYFGLDDPASVFTGAMFDAWDTTGNRITDLNRFTQDDFLSLACLSEAFATPALHTVLVKDASRFNRLLSEIPSDLDMADVAQPWTSEHPAWRLHVALVALPDVGRTRASKIMARKRPRLIPVYDSFVAHEMGINGQHWEPLRQMLRAGLKERLRLIQSRAQVPDSVSLLRVLDVIAWKDRWDALRASGTPQG